MCLAVVLHLLKTEKKKCLCERVCVLPAASCVVLFHIFYEVSLFVVSRSGRTTREITGPGRWTEKDRDFKK